MFLMKYMKWDPKLVNEAREHSENEMQPKKTQLSYRNDNIALGSDVKHRSRI